MWMKSELGWSDRKILCQLRTYETGIRGAWNVTRQEVSTRTGREPGAKFGIGKKLSKYYQNLIHEVRSTVSQNIIESMNSDEIGNVAFVSKRRTILENQLFDQIK